MERFAIKIDKNLRANLYKICRLCGIDNPEKVKVLDDETTIHLEDEEPELWKKVLDCIGLLITKDDKMPQFMCTLCVDKINDFFEFREMCYATDGQTRKLLGIKEEPKLKAALKPSTSVECKSEDTDIKQATPVQRTSRKRRNADMDICNASIDIKTDEIDDIKPATTSTSSSKKKRIKLDNTETDTKPLSDMKPGIVNKPGPASRMGLSKKGLKVEPSTSKYKKDQKPNKMTKLMRRRLKVESPPPKVEEPNRPLQTQKKKALELLKQRKMAKKVAVVKVEKLRKGSAESKIKEEETVPASISTIAQPKAQAKVKLKDKCTICTESFTNKALLDKHVKSTHIPNVVRYHCVHCNETLKKNMEIKNHNLWHKLSKTPFQCGNCSESSCSIYTYSKHIRDCSQVSYIDAHIPNWHCPDCRGVFETTYLFNIHACVSNTLVCPGCDRSHKWKEDYFKHIPTCAAAVHRIPSYMSSNIQVKNEAENPTSPVPSHNALVLSATAANVTLQPTPSSRITPPLMDSNQCVVIPGNVNLLEEASSPSSKSGSRKSKRITKKDLKRFDKLLKSTMTTLVSIKQEPAVGDDALCEQSTSPDNRGVSPSPPGSTASLDCDFLHNDDDDDSADEQTSSSQPVGVIKQEIIDEGYRDLYNNIEVNIKREVVLHDNRNTEMTPAKKTGENVAELAEVIAPKPVLKLKITKEHGTLNSVLLDSPKSEKKKKKKKRKEEKLKAAEQEALAISSDVPVASDVPRTSDVPNVTDESIGEEPAMPLPEIVCIKKEITHTEEEEEEEEEEGGQGELDALLSSQSSHSTPSIVAATSGSLQISCVSEGVHFNGEEENDEEESTLPAVQSEVAQEDAGSELSATITEEPQEDIDVKPRLEDLIPMLQIASVTSGENLIEKPVKAPVKRKRHQTVVAPKPSVSTPQILSVSSGSDALAFQPEPEKPSGDEEEAFEKMDNNENVFDYSQVRVKEEVVDPSYDEQDCEMPEEEDVDGEHEDEDEEGDKEKEKEELESNITEKQAEENAYIANIDFNNLNIKQEKEYIDDGLDNPADDDTGDTDSETSSDSEDSDSESEREYRDLPSEDDESPVQAAAEPLLAPLGLQISAVHSEFTCPQSKDENEKTESQLGAQKGSDDKIKSNSTTVCADIETVEEEKMATSLVEVNSEEDSSKIQTEVDCSIESLHLSRCDIQEVKEPVENEPKLCELSSLVENPPLATKTVDEATSHGVNELDCSSTLQTNKPSTSAAADAITTILQRIEDPATCDTETESSAIHQPIHQVGSASLTQIQSTGDADKNVPSIVLMNESLTVAANETNQVSIDSVDHPTHNASSITGLSYTSDDISTLIDINMETSCLVNDVQAPQDSASNDMSDLLEQTPSAIIHDASTVSELEEDISITSDINRIVDQIPAITIEQFDDDIIMNEIEPITSAISLIIEQPHSPVMTQHLSVLPSGDRLPCSLSFPQTIAPTSHSTIDQFATTITSEVEDVSAAPAETNLTHFEAKTSANVPSSDFRDPSTEFHSSTVQNAIGPQPLSPFSHSTKKQKPADSYHAEYDNAQQSSCSDENKKTSENREKQNKAFESPAEINETYSDTAPPFAHFTSSTVSRIPPLTTSAKQNAGDSSVSVDLSNSFLNSFLPLFTSKSSDEFNQNSHVASAPTYAAELNRFSSESTYDSGNLNLAELCTATPTPSSNLTEAQVALTPIPTAGQLHIPNNEPPLTSELSALTTNSLITDADLSVPVLSEEVENLLNEDTVAASNFEQNDAILRARSSASTSTYYPSAPSVAVPLPNFTDLENVNEIAENNNNANIERELQDELGNVIAAAIADNDEVDENNVMNENRANFDIT